MPIQCASCFAPSFHLVDVSHHAGGESEAPEDDEETAVAQDVN